MGVTLLFCAEFKQVNFFPEEHIEIFNSASATFYQINDLRILKGDPLL